MNVVANQSLLVDVAQCRTSRVSLGRVQEQRVAMPIQPVVCAAVGGRRGAAGCGATSIAVVRV